MNLAKTKMAELFNKGVTAWIKSLKECISVLLFLLLLEFIFLQTITLGISAAIIAAISSAISNRGIASSLHGQFEIALEVAAKLASVNGS